MTYENVKETDAPEEVAEVTTGAIRDRRRLVDRMRFNAIALQHTPQRASDTRQVRRAKERDEDKVERRQVARVFHKAFLEAHRTATPAM